MSYHLYQTKGVVLDSRNFGEENEFLFIFTKDLGLIKVFAKSIKKTKSKLRPSLQKFSWVNITLIKGKTGIRITGAVEITNSYYSFQGKEGKIKILGRTYALLLRMLQGEEKDYKLYKIIENQKNYLQNKKDLNEDFLKKFEILSVSRILHCLGYLSEDEKILEFIKTDYFDDVLVNKFSKYSTMALKMINKSFEESHI